MVVVMSETREARFAAGVVVLQSFYEFPQLLPSLLLLLQPLSLLLRRHSDDAAVN